MPQNQEWKSSASERIEKLTLKRKRDVELAAFIREEYQATAEAIERCAGMLTLRHYWGLNETRLINCFPSFCRKRFLCSLCDSIRAARTLGRYVDRTFHVLRNKKMLRAYLVTFTVKDGPDLGERMLHLRTAHRSMMKARTRWITNQRARAETWTEAAKADGFLYSIEVKRGSGSGQWHPHLHAVWLCWEQPDENALRQEWQRRTGDSFIVDVRPFHCHASDSFLREDLAKDLHEVVKYSLKFSDMSFCDQLTAYKTLRTKIKGESSAPSRAARMTGSGGSLWGLSEADVKTDERCPKEDADGRYVDSIWHWMEENARYECKGQADAYHNVLTGEVVYARRLSEAANGST